MCDAAVQKPNGLTVFEYDAWRALSGLVAWLRWFAEHDHEFFYLSVFDDPGLPVRPARFVPNAD